MSTDLSPMSFAAKYTLDLTLLEERRLVSQYEVASQIRWYGFHMKLVIAIAYNPRHHLV